MTRTAAERIPVLRLSSDAAGELLVLQRACYLDEGRLHGSFELPPLTQTVAEIVTELADPDVVAWGARIDGRLVGSVRIRLHRGAAGGGSRRAVLSRLVVAPDRQGHGLGTRLLHHAEEHLPADVDRIELFTGEHSAANLRLYARHGYVESHRSPAGDHTLVHLAKDLDPDRPRPVGAATPSLEGRVLVGVDNTGDGEVDTATVFHYHEADGAIWAEYAGGVIVRGRLVGTRTGDDLDFRYVHLAADATTSAGRCRARLELLDDGRLRSHEAWEWESRPGAGHSTVEERPTGPSGTRPLP